MTLNWITISNILIFIIMLFPNFAFLSKKNKQDILPDGHPVLEIIEQIGRYASVLFMILPLGIGEFGFSSKALFMVYLIGNVILQIAYNVGWIVLYAGQKKLKTNLVLLAVIPTGMFLLCGSTLRYWPLILSAAVFGIGHIPNTVVKTKKLK